jgi:hypothetical protein
MFFKLNMTFSPHLNDYRVMMVMMVTMIIDGNGVDGDDGEIEREWGGGWKEVGRRAATRSGT